MTLSLTNKLNQLFVNLQFRNRTFQTRGNHYSLWNLHQNPSAASHAGEMFTYGKKYPGRKALLIIVTLEDDVFKRENKNPSLTHIGEEV